jgi:uncharacterized membrane protein YqiK
MGDLEFLIGGLGGGVAAFAVFFIGLGVLKSIIKVANTDKLLVVTGRKVRREGKSFGFSVERGRTAVIPYFQSLGHLDLSVFPVNVRVEGVNSANGITVGADATACVCVDDDDDAMLFAAVERLMGKGKDQIHDQIQQTLVGNFRGALNKATPLQAIGMEDTSNEQEDSALGERAQFRAELFNDINSDLRSFGMKVVSVSLQKIWDTSNYIANLAQKTLAEKRQQVEIEEARLRAAADQAESDSARRIQVAKAKADELILASREKLEVFRQSCEGKTQEASLKADQAIAEAKNRGEAQVQARLNELQKLKNRSELTIEAQAREEAARILAEGEAEAIRLSEEARNEVLARKAKLLAEAGDDAAMVLFFKERLPALFERYKERAGAGGIDRLLIMNDTEGIEAVANRGPRAFADFLGGFKEAFGIDIAAMSGFRSAGKEASK